MNRYFFMLVVFGYKIMTAWQGRSKMHKTKRGIQRGNSLKKCSGKVNNLLKFLQKIIETLLLSAGLHK
jgi:hypothetical protein